jgi:hypothetical protein
MPLAGNVPNFSGVIGESACGVSALSPEDLYRANTDTAEVTSLPGECLFLTHIILISLSHYFVEFDCYKYLIAR